MTLGNVDFINMTQKALIKKKRLLHRLQCLIIKKKKKNMTRVKQWVPKNRNGYLQCIKQRTEIHTIKFYESVRKVRKLILTGKDN